MRLLPSILSTFTLIQGGFGIEWNKKTYRDVIQSISKREEANWGYPIRIDTRLQSRAWDDCPPLEKGPNVKEIKCNNSTCVMKCMPGFVKVGRGRTRCRASAEKGFFWGFPLGECKGCAEGDPQVTDPDMDINCKLTRAGKRQCQVLCPVGRKIEGFPLRKFKVNCKCPRNKDCGWFKRMKSINVGSLKCAPKPTPAPVPSPVPVASNPAPVPAPVNPPVSQPDKVPNAPVPAPAHPFEPFSGEFESGTDKITIKETCPLNNNFRRFVTDDDSKIVNGATAAAHSWPWIVRMGFNRGFSQALCGGTIIDNEWIVTAAHCCEGRDSVDVTVGDHSRHSTETGEFSVNSDNMFIHPKYKSGNGFDWDICLVKVTNLSNAKPSSCNNCFGAACLPREMPDLHGRHCWVAGWGLNKEGGSVNSILNEVGVNLFSHEYCTTKSDYGTFIMADSEICAGVPDLNGDGLTDGGKDACQGDSGGPLVCNDNGSPVLYGVVSWGDGCARRGAPGVYTNVNSAIPWIDQIVKNR